MGPGSSVPRARLLGGFGGHFSATNIATQQKAAELLNAGDIDSAVDTMFAPDALDPEPAPDQGPGREGFRVFFAC